MLEQLTALSLRLSNHALDHLLFLVLLGVPLAWALRARFRVPPETPVRAPVRRLAHAVVLRDRALSRAHDARLTTTGLQDTLIELSAINEHGRLVHHDALIALMREHHINVYE